MTEAQRLNEFLENAPELVKHNSPLIYYLSGRGFFSAPASTKYHGAYEGGLYDHSKAVYERLQTLTDKLGLQWERPESPYIVGWFHDLCKIDQYELVVDDPGMVMMGGTDVTGYQYHYEYRTDLPIRGHGEKSVIYLAQFIPMTFEEIMCIRYHMGAFGDESSQRDYGNAVQQCPNVLWTHTADMFASKVEGT